MAGANNGKIAVRRGLKDPLGFCKSLENFGRSEQGRARSTHRHWEERRPSTDGLISKVNCIIMRQEMRRPSTTTVGRFEPVGAGLAEGGPEDDGVGVGGANGAELLDLGLFAEDGAGAVAWLGRSVRWCERWYGSDMQGWVSG